MKNLQEKRDIEIKIAKTSNNISYIIMQLKNISDKIDMLAMNKIMSKMKKNILNL